MDIERELFNTWLENEHLQQVQLFPAKTTIVDPTEGTKRNTFMNPISIKALVMDFKPETLRWKFYGQIPMGSKQVICQKKYKVLFKLAKKIKIGTDYFKTWVDDQNGFGIMEREDYIVVILSFNGNNIKG